MGDRLSSEDYEKHALENLLKAQEAAKQTAKVKRAAIAKAKAEAKAQAQAEAQAQAQAKAGGNGKANVMKKPSAAGGNGKAHVMPSGCKLKDVAILPWDESLAERPRLSILSKFYHHAKKQAENDLKMFAKAMDV